MGLLYLIYPVPLSLRLLWTFTCIIHDITTTVHARASYSILYKTMFIEPEIDGKRGQWRTVIMLPGIDEYKLPSTQVHATHLYTLTLKIKVFFSQNILPAIPLVHHSIRHHRHHSF